MKADPRDAKKHEMPQRMGEPDHAGQPVRTQAVRQAPAPYVDPYDMRTEPQPEEPGYGHGV